MSIQERVRNYVQLKNPHVDAGYAESEQDYNGRRPNRSKKSIEEEFAVILKDLSDERKELVKLLST